MKKILLTIAMAATSTLLFAQGSIVFYNIASANGNYYNTNGVPTLTPTSSAAPSAYYYTLLIAAYGSGAPADNPTASAWSQAIIANPATTVNGHLLLGNNSITAGSLTGQMGSSYTALSGTTASSDEYYMLVGWSSSVGITWNAVLTEMETSTLPQGYLGWSPVGTGLLGPTGGPGVSMFASGSGVTGGITMQPTIPEPSTLALAGLGSLSLLLFRRRK